MPTPPPAYERFERAFRRGDHLTVLAEGDRVADELSTTGRNELLAEVLVQIGSVHATQDRYGVAAGYLEQGLALAASLAPPPAPASPVGPRPSGPAGAPTPAWLRTGPFDATGGRAGSGSGPPGVPGAAGATNLPGAPGLTGGSPPGSNERRAARATNRLDWFELDLIDIRLRTGRFDDVLARVNRLMDPTHTTDVRFAATRAQAAALGAQGNHEGAHHLLNTAGGIATRVRSRFRAALVEGDRAVLLAGQGRLFEAITSADRVLASLIRPPVGEYQQWANAEGAAVALTVSRAASAGGDSLTAQRMLLLGATATQRVGSTYLQGHLDLSRGAFWLLERDLDNAEASLLSASQKFGLLGCAPAAALATREQGRVAHARGLIRSARPLYQQALADFRRLGQPGEANEVNRLLAALPA